MNEALLTYSAFFVFDEKLGYNMPVMTQRSLIWCNINRLNQLLKIYMENAHICWYSQTMWYVIVKQEPYCICCSKSDFYENLSALCYVYAGGYVSSFLIHIRQKCHTMENMRANCPTCVLQVLKMFLDEAAFRWHHLSSLDAALSNIKALSVSANCRSATPLSVGKCVLIVTVQLNCI